MAETKEAHSRNYFWPEILALKVLGVSLTGNESLAYRVYSLFLLAFFHIPYPIIASGDMFKYEFKVAGQLMTYIFGTTMGAGMTTLVYLNRGKLGKLIQNLEREPFTPNIDRGGETEEKLVDQWLLFYSKLRLIFHVGVAISVVPPILITLIKRLSSSDYHDWAFGFGPLTILNVTRSPNYEISWMYQNICLICASYSINLITVLVAGIFSYVSLQFRLLQNNLAHVIKRARRNFKKDKSSKNKIRNSEIPWMYHQKTLKQAIDFHINILDIGAEMESTLSILILWMFSAMLVTLCFEIVRATQIPLNDPSSFGMLIELLVIAFQPFIICYCGEQVAHQSLEVGRAAYEVNFVGTDVRFQKELLIIIRRSQSMMRLKAGKFVETSMTTFVWIVRTAYSAFMMLRNTNMKT